MNNDQIFRLAKRNGCQPFWFYGVFGPSWHCGCDDVRHVMDQQCSAITEKSAKKRRLEIVR